MNNLDHYIITKISIRFFLLTSIFRSHIRANLTKTEAL